METEDKASIHKLAHLNDDFFCGSLDVIIEEEMPDTLGHEFGLDLNPTHRYSGDAETQLLNSDCLANEGHSLPHNQNKSFDDETDMSCVGSRMCNLPGNDCIKKSILYCGVSGSQDAGVGYSDSSSSSADYPLNNGSSLDEGTYSVLEELPSDSIYSQTQSTHHESRNLKMLLQCYSDSFSESEERTSRPVSDRQDVYRYFRKCFEATENIEQMNASKVVYEDVVEKVINQYRYHEMNLRGVKMDTNTSGVRLKDSTTSAGWSSPSEQSSSSDEAKFCGIFNTAGKWPHWNSSSFDLSSPSPEYQAEDFFSSSDTSCKLCPNISHEAGVTREEQHSSQSSVINQRPECESPTEGDLLDMILEPPDMFKSDEEGEFVAVGEVKGIYREDSLHMDRHTATENKTAQDYQIIKSSTHPSSTNIACEVTPKPMLTKQAEVANTESALASLQNKGELVQNNLVTYPFDMDSHAGTHNVNKTSQDYQIIELSVDSSNTNVACEVTPKHMLTKQAEVANAESPLASFQNRGELVQNNLVTDSFNMDSLTGSQIKTAQDYQMINSSSHPSSTNISCEVIPKHMLTKQAEIANAESPLPFPQNRDELVQNNLVTDFSLTGSQNKTAQDYQKINSSSDPSSTKIACEVTPKHVLTNQAEAADIESPPASPQNKDELVQNNLVAAEELIIDDILVCPCINSYHNFTHLVDCEDEEKRLASTCRLNFSLLVKEYSPNISQSKLKLFNLAAHSRCHNWSHILAIAPAGVAYATSVIRSTFPVDDVVVLGYGDQNRYYCSGRIMQPDEADSDKLGMPAMWSSSWLLSEANCISRYSMDPCPKLVVAPQVHDSIFALPVDPEGNAFIAPADVTSRVNSTQDKAVKSCVSLDVSNMEAILEFSDYWKKSLASELGDKVAHLDQATDSKAELDEDMEQVTSFVFSSSSSSSSSDISDDEDAAPIKGDSTLEKALSENTLVSPLTPVGILKSTTSKKDKKKHSVHFDESMNEFFDANYVIVFHDENYDAGDDSDEYCDCGDEFCCEKAYQEEESFQFQLDGSQVNCAPTLFADPVNSSQPQSRKDECSLDLETPVDAMAHAHYENSGEAGAQMEGQRELWTDSVTFDGKSESVDQAAEMDSCYVAKKDPQKLGYPLHSKDTISGSQPTMLNGISESSDHLAHYIIETIRMASHNNIDQQPLNPLELNNVLADNNNNNNANGILKADKLWYHQDMSALGVGNLTTNDILLNSVNKMVSFDEKCRVEFLQDHFDEDDADSDGQTKNYNCGGGDFTLTFKMGNRMVPCNSLKPNSAVRQLFPDPRFVDSSMSKSKIDCNGSNTNKYPGKYLVTEESLKAFNEVNKRSVFTSFRGQEGGSSQEDGHPTSRQKSEAALQNDLFRKTIDQNSLRRRLFSENYNPSGSSSNVKKKSEISLEERIKQLTCNLDDDQVANNMAQRKYLVNSGRENNHKTDEEAGSKALPTAAVKLVSLYQTLERKANNNQSPPVCYQPVYQMSELDPSSDGIRVNQINSKISVPVNKACERFAASVEPPSCDISGDSSNYTDYSFDRPDNDSSQLNINGSNWNDSNQDELVMFVQQDARRIERIRQRYITSGSDVDSRASNNNQFNRDDNAFNCGNRQYGSIAPLGSTMNILQHIQQLSYYQVSGVSPSEPILKDDGISNNSVQKLCYVPSNYVDKKPMSYY